MLLYHGSSETVEFPEIRKARFNKDFYFGFYCTQYREQAVRWASRYGKTGFINTYEYTPDPGLNYLVFEMMTEEWLDFIVSCRRGISHTYDIVEGPMADDTIYNYIRQQRQGTRKDSLPLRLSALRLTLIFQSPGFRLKKKNPTDRWYSKS